ncbi:MAG: nucleotidyltransferase substrate binding protein, partial [Treponema sp.]|nr:nucleotidyltransferase substrate binding protein [Treponema sp.]
YNLANENEIYRTGVIGQFNLTFELAWKALQAVLRLHGAEVSSSGSPREILQAGFKAGFIENSVVWLSMLKKRNESTHIYDEAEINEMLLLIRDSFVPAFTVLEKTLREKIIGLENDIL